ncbi:uroporphyrinogen-III synthase, partial [Mycobacterium sp.]|uniref:uroporphyrinogen-III synthase n=1 Tax=Mycobacterium sp. TaxID=1785 RepID=UPI002DA2A1C7|nr:uroporphyrinogen-III synthase [Mycobacterium sp.]
MSEPDWAPLTGFRVAVTSARRSDELSALLQRRGATVTSAAAIAMVALPDDDELRAHTEALIDVPPDIVIATTGIGFRGWVAAADGWGLANELIVALGKARIVSRGPKATGALRAAGLPEEWSPESESSRELLHYLVEGGIEGQRIAVQLHGATDDWDPFPEFLDELRAAGAEVVPIRVYRWHPAPRNGDFDQLVAGIAEEKFDAVSFTSAPAVASVLMRANEMGIEDEVLSALRTSVHAMCVGPVTARPLVRLGVPTSAPERMRLGALARHITDELPLLQSRTVRVAGHTLE